MYAHLTRNSLWHVLAVCCLLPARYLDARPGPVRAATFAALDVDIDCILVDRSSDVLEHKVLDRHAICRLALDAVVRLGNDNAVVSIVSGAVDDNVAVGNIRYAPCFVGNGFLRQQSVSLYSPDERRRPAHNSDRLL